MPASFLTVITCETATRLKSAIAGRSSLYFFIARIRHLAGGLAQCSSDDVCVWLNENGRGGGGAKVQVLQEQGNNSETTDGEPPILVSGERLRRV